MNYLTKPKIRQLNVVQQDIYEGTPVFIVQDSWQLIQARIPQVLGPLVMLCNGRREIAEIKTALATEYGLDFSPEDITHWVSQLDNAYLVEGEQFEQAKRQFISQFRGAPYRQPFLAGRSYPAEPAALTKLLRDYLGQIPPAQMASPHSRAIFSPHIDYQRGGPIYAQVWASAAQAVSQAELIIMFATDHKGDVGTLTLTPQNYASPLGVMPTDQTLVNHLAEAIGTGAAFADELNHINEHSIELALVWLQHVRQGKPCPFVPILCGSFYPYLTGQADIKQQTAFTAMLDLLREEMGRRHTLIVASGDLAHLGPAFDEPPLDETAYQQMKFDDKVLLDKLCQGQADDFFAFMQAGQYKRNVCGLSPFYFALKLLGQSQGQVRGYDRCIADNHNSSFVSVAGLVFE